MVKTFLIICFLIIMDLYKLVLNHIYFTVIIWLDDKKISVPAENNEHKKIPASCKLLHGLALETSTLNEIKDKKESNIILDEISNRNGKLTSSRSFPTGFKFDNNTNLLNIAEDSIINEYANTIQRDVSTLHEEIYQPKYTDVNRSRSSSLSPRMLNDMKIKNQIIKCIFTNKNNINVTIHMPLTDYLDSNKHLKPMYKKFLSTKQNQSIINLNENIKLFCLSDTIFYEIRTNITKYNNNNILAHISSQIRTPLNTILGMVLSLQDTDMTPLQKSYITDIENSCYDIISQMNDLVDIVNLGKNNVKIRQNRFNLKQNIIDALKIHFSKQTPIKFNLRIDKDVSKVIKTDSSRLIQILINIIKYSIKSTNTTELDIIVRYHTETDCKNCPFGCADEFGSKKNVLFIINDNYKNFIDEQIYQIEEILGMVDIVDDSTKNNHRLFETHNIISHNCDLNLLIARYICNLLCGNVWIKTDEPITKFNKYYVVNYYFNIMCDT
jgi:hypothetical protein